MRVSIHASSRRQLRSCLALPAFLGLLACGSLHRDPGGSGPAGSPAPQPTELDRKPPLLPDASVAEPDNKPLPLPDANLAASTPHPTNIIIENAGPEPILLDNNCGGQWTSILRDGLKLEIDRYCKTTCDRPDIGGCPAICLRADRLLLPGERKTFAWDGVVLQRERQSCMELRHPEPSTQLTAQACWNSELPWSTAPVCASATFRYAETDEVLIRAAAIATPPRSTKLALRNTLDHPIEILTSHCDHQDVFTPDGATVLYANCACACSAASRDRGCPTVWCGACSGDVFEVLQPGASFEFEWDQKLWYPVQAQCWFQHALQPGDTIRMKGCWREPASGKIQCAAAPTAGTDARVTIDTTSDSRCISCP